MSVYNIKTNAGTMNIFFILYDLRVQNLEKHQVYRYILNLQLFFGPRSCLLYFDVRDRVFISLNFFRI